MHFIDVCKTFLCNLVLIRHDIFADNQVHIYIQIQSLYAPEN